jgi:glycosyltransferase involved in cell wall biosynthesis
MHASPSTGSPATASSSAAISPIDRRPAIVFMWEQFSAYHVDRLEAMAAAFRGAYEIVGIEVASRSLTYAWAPVVSGGDFRRQTLFPGGVSDAIPWPRKLRHAMRAIRAARPRAVFLCNQDNPEILAALVLLRLSGTRTYAMLDAKFDDTPRRVLKEALKRPVFALFNGGLVAGARTVAYARFLGLREGWARTAYDTVSIARVRRDAATPPAPCGAAHAMRDFVVVARFVPKKNLPLAIRAYAFYRTLPTSQSRTRRLVLCGAGPLEAMLRALAAELGVADGVEFAGFLDHEAVARRLGTGLALILPSVEEQWGLVVNEAVAMGLPVLCSDNVGARDSLVRVAVNGFVFEPDNHEGLARLMHLLAENAALWQRLAEGSLRLAPNGDVAEFVRGVCELLAIAPAEHGAAAAAPAVAPADLAEVSAR